MKRKVKVLEQGSRTNCFLNNVAVALLVIGLTGLNLLLSTQAVALDIDFYVSQWVRLDVPSSTRMSIDDLKLVGTHLHSYFSGAVSAPQVTAVVEGNPRQVFRDHEIEHLRDVRALFQLGFMAKRICAALAGLGLGIALLRKDTSGRSGSIRRFALHARNMARCLSYSLKLSGGLLLVVMMLLAVPAALDFTRWWTCFHLVTFDNDLWRLDPSTDWLIRMFPEEFFFAAVKRIWVYSALITAAYVASGLLLGLSVRYLSSNYGEHDF